MFTNLANELGHHIFLGIEVGEIHGFRPGLVGKMSKMVIEDMI